MSDRLRIALVAEGPTDRLMVEAILRAVMPRPFILKQLQPEMSQAFGHAGGNGGGWSGVYKWCVDAAHQGGGRLSGNGLLRITYDLLIIHVDADVAGVSYGSGNITPMPSDLALPCARPCPPVEDTVNALRAVLLSWCGENKPPPRIVLCIPSKSMEAWVAAALFPQDSIVNRSSPPFECCAAPEARLGVQPARVRIAKSVPAYRSKQTELSAAWPRLAGPGGLSQAARFDTDLRGAIA
jgi:hypothetical protein